jgi:Rho-binding antiterminator
MTDADNRKPYAPINCDSYSEYELAIMHRSKLRLRWHDDNVVYDQTVLPIDLKTLQHEEFLICRDDGGGMHTIRLDRIQKMESA